jgi:hypothetical protein
MMVEIEAHFDSELLHFFSITLRSLLKIDLTEIEALLSTRMEYLA